MAELLRKEKRLNDALSAYLEVCYIDLNGPINCGSIDHKSLEKKDQFNSDIAFLADGIVGRIEKIINDSDITKDNVESIFLKSGERMQRSLGTPISAKKCWLSIEEQLNRDGVWKK